MNLHAQSGSYDGVGQQLTCGDDVGAALIERMNADSELCEFIAKATYCFAGRSGFDPQGNSWFIPRDNTGAALLQLYRDEDWIAFGTQLKKAVDELQLIEANRELRA